LKSGILRNALYLPPKNQLISSNGKNIITLNLLFFKEGFSYCTQNGKIYSDVSVFKVSNLNLWEEEVIKELEINLKLRRNFEQVNVGLISGFFTLVPNQYLTESRETLLDFSEGEFENNILLQSETRFGCNFVYGTSLLLTEKLSELYRNVNFYHSGTVFLNAVETEKEKTLYLNLNYNQLEIFVAADADVIFYNLIETPTVEDVLFFTLFTAEQLNLDLNQISVNCYGELMPDNQAFQMLKKYVRNLNTAMKNEVFLKNFTLFNLSSCES